MAVPANSARPRSLRGLEPSAARSCLLCRIASRATAARQPATPDPDRLRAGLRLTGRDQATTACASNSGPATESIQQPATASRCTHGLARATVLAATRAVMLCGSWTWTETPSSCWPRTSSATPPRKRRLKRSLTPSSSTESDGRRASSASLLSHGNLHHASRTFSGAGVTPALHPDHFNRRSACTARHPIRSAYGSHALGNIERRTPHGIRSARVHSSTRHRAADTADTVAPCAA